MSKKTRWTDDFKKLIVALDKRGKQVSKYHMNTGEQRR